ncbi:MAG: septum formation protein Maf [Gammaproteobacteria bacterium]|nr:septum formation protein Maf [Gammaproteobacteria bacterium]MYF02620.1 septum formation protein Maf [Gammaproteobacteria bacterium]MYI77703.1 septum formation protein Maf [Gammaproteobacteria bacterium]
MPDLVLASSSQYRQQQLASLGYRFRIATPDIDERPLPSETPRAIAQRVATMKARVVAQKFPKYVVIGSDQTGVCNGQLLVKPNVFETAQDMLLSFRGQSVCFFTAVSVLDPSGKTLCDVVKTEVQFRDFTKREVNAYLTLDQPWDCAGAIKSEAHGPLLFKSVRSEDPTAIVGLPLIRTSEFLRECGINPLELVDAKTLQNTTEREPE